MALLNTSNNYIRITEDGTAYFYDSAEDRINELSNIIESAKEKYNEILESRYNEMVAAYEHLGLTNEEYENRYDELVNEYPELKRSCDAYFTALNEFTDFNNLVAIECAESLEGREFFFPIIEEYYPNIKEHMPRYLIVWQQDLVTNSAEESYMKAKELGVFGETTDC